MKSIKSFEDFSAKSTKSIDEAMVQVAGKSKPSGAKVLASIICDMINKEYGISGYSGSQVKYIQDEVANLIMDSTF